MKDFITQNEHPYDLGKLEVTAMVRETLVELIKDISIRLSYSPSSVWGSSGDRPDYVGAWIVRLDYERNSQLVKKIHGKVIKHLFNAGVIKVAPGVTTKKRIMFELTEGARGDVRGLRRAIDFPHRKTVRWTDLNELAALYGVCIEYQRVRGLLKLVKLDGSSFREDEFITHNAAGEPVTKINDVTWGEWVKILEECADLIEKSN